ncbi:MAG: rRNA maturation RNase YbeY [Lachnospiraceae bacterium]|nr:rRNA maturation RNase YbeY [Lachnospiraceae bacterium]
MTIRIDNESEKDIGIDYERIAKDVAAAALDYVDCPYECEVNILLTDNAGIQAMNHRMRSIDAPTDVLSFPTIEFETEGDFSIVEDDILNYFNAESGELLLGDIMISLEKAAEQAKQFNHSMKREYAFLIAHSMLHLSGYDHMEEAERIQMEHMQEEILQSIGYTREIMD